LRGRENCSGGKSEQQIEFHAAQNTGALWPRK
jgi:hypothetical protein